MSDENVGAREVANMTAEIKQLESALAAAVKERDEARAELAELRGRSCGNCGSKCDWPGVYGVNICSQWTPKQEPAKPEHAVCEWVYDWKAGFYRTDRCGNHYKFQIENGNCPICGKPVKIKEES